MQEARAASALNHPNIVTLYDIANDSGADYLVMEYVPGKSLDKLIGPKDCHSLKQWLATPSSGAPKDLQAPKHLKKSVN
jgi:serine/threonine protein kinase